MLNKWKSLLLVLRQPLMGRNALSFLVRTNAESISPKPYQTWADITSTTSFGKTRFVLSRTCNSFSGTTNFALKNAGCTCSGCEILENISFLQEYFNTLIRNQLSSELSFPRKLIGGAV